MPVWKLLASALTSPGPKARLSGSKVTDPLTERETPTIESSGASTVKRTSAAGTSDSR